MNLTNLFNEPKTIAVISDVNQGKSNLLYYILKELSLNAKFKLYTYGLRKDIKNAVKIYSINELENIKNSVIVCDEFNTLFNLEDRVYKPQIEATFRLLFHSNNIIILSGTPDNFKKFISAKLNIIIYKKSTFSDFINGSSCKRILLNYHGYEKGTSILNLNIDEALIYNGNHYEKIKVEYMKEQDTKLNNEQIVKNIVKENIIKA